MARPLDGVRVLDFTRVLSGPHCTRTLCDLGAEVIKVEPPAGDLSRFANPRVNGLATYYIQQNTGKRNISLDMTKPEAVSLLLQLVEHCDVVVENFRPGVMDRMGLGYAAVAARHAAVVYCSLSGYGQDGPWKNRRAYASVVGAESGFTRHQSEVRGGPPANDPHSNADVYTGMECAVAILAALFDRQRTGRGTHIDVSMAETMLYVNEHVQNQLWDGEAPPGWVRSFEPGAYPVFTAANREMVVASAHPAERGTFEMLMRAAGRHDLIDDAGLATVEDRLPRLAEIVGVLHAWGRTMPDAATIEAALHDQGLAAGPLLGVRDVAETDWAAARQVVVPVSDRGGGTVRIPNAPFRFDGEHLGVRGEPRYRGEDNRDVLGELLALDDGTLDELEARGVLSSRVPQ